MAARIQLTFFLIVNDDRIGLVDKRNNTTVKPYFMQRLLTISIVLPSLILLISLLACDDSAPQTTGEDVEGPRRDASTNREVTINTFDEMESDVSHDTDTHGFNEDDLPRGTDVPVIIDLGNGGEICDEMALFLKPDSNQVANVIIALDRSASMANTGQWWDTILVVQGLVNVLENSVNFGLTLFPDPLNPSNTCSPGSIMVEPTAGAADIIQDNLWNFEHRPDGATPTAGTLMESEHYYLLTYPGAINYVLLVTDGAPNCNEALIWPDCTYNEDSTRCIDDERTLRQIQALAENSIPTWVVGLPGSETTTGLLDEMAVLGETDIEGSHYAVSDINMLVDVLESAIGSVVPCRYEMDVEPYDTERISLELDGDPIVRDESHSNGWDLVDERYIEVYGSVCNTMRDGELHNLVLYTFCPE
jgi:hypothetical protein